MSGVGVPEKGLSRSQSIRCLETSAVLMKIWQKGFPLEQRMLSEGRCG